MPNQALPARVDREALLTRTFIGSARKETFTPAVQPLGKIREVAQATYRQDGITVQGKKLIRRKRRDPKHDWGMIRSFVWDITLKQQWDTIS